MSELYHHGVKGMKWGVRKSDPQKQTTQGKRHLSLDEKGRIILTRSDDKVSKKAKQAFALRIGISTAASLGFYYLSKHPQLLNQTIDKINKVDRMAEIEKSIQESLEKGPEIVKKMK